jgi:hypothetical protein
MYSLESPIVSTCFILFYFKLSTYLLCFIILYITKLILYLCHLGVIYCYVMRLVIRLISDYMF